MADSSSPATECRPKDCRRASCGISRTRLSRTFSFCAGPSPHGTRFSARSMRLIESSSRSRASRFIEREVAVSNVQNETPYRHATAILPDLEGRERLVLLVKATLHLSSHETSSTQQPIHYTDVYFPSGALQYPCDLSLD